MSVVTADSETEFALKLSSGSKRKRLSGISTLFLRQGEVAGSNKRGRRTNRLGILYESFIHPITILSTLPSAGVGALLALR